MKSLSEKSDEEIEQSLKSILTEAFDFLSEKEKAGSRR